MLFAIDGPLYTIPITDTAEPEFWPNPLMVFEETVFAVVVPVLSIQIPTREALTPAPVFAPIMPIPEIVLPVTIDVPALERIPIVLAAVPALAFAIGPVVDP